MLKDVTLREASSLEKPVHVFTSSGSTNVCVRFMGTPGLNPTVFGGTFVSTAGLKWNPDSSDAVLVLSNGVSTTKGDVVVSKGTVRLVSGATFTALSRLSIATDCAFEVARGAGVGFHAARLDLADATARLSVDFGVMAFDKVFLDGEELSAGVYTAETTPWLSGGGYVLVGGATLPVAAENWWRSVDENDPVLAANVATNYTGIALSGAAAALTAGAGSTVVLGAQGLTTAGEGVGYGYAWPTYLADTQTWTIGGGDTVTLSDDFFSPANVTWKKEGTGTLVFEGPRTYAGNLVVSNGMIIARGDDSLGSASGSVTFEVTSPTQKGVLKILPEEGKNEVSFHRPITFHYAVDGEHGDFMILPENTTVNFHGAMQTSDKARHSGPGYPCHWNYSCPSSTTVHWYGGMHAQLNHGFPGGHHYIHKALTGGDRFHLSGNAQVELLAPNNSVGSATGNISSGTLFTRVPYALDGKVGQNRVLVVGGGTIDLCGNDQALSVLRMTSGRITSERPALMRIRGNWALASGNGGYPVTVSNTVICTGAAGLSMERTVYPLVISGVSSTTGAVQVVQGDLVLRPTAVWTNASEVVVQGGTLKVESRTAAQGPAFGRQVAVRLSSAGTLDLDSGFKAFSLEIDGVSQKRGTYGSSASDAMYKLDSCFAGTGVISVLGDGKGMAIILR